MTGPVPASEWERLTGRSLVDTFARREDDLRQHRRVGYADPTTIDRLEVRLRDLRHDQDHREGGVDVLALAILEGKILDLNEPIEDRR